MAATDFLTGLHLMKCLAQTQGPKVRVNAVLPGLLLTEWVCVVFCLVMLVMILLLYNGADIDKKKTGQSILSRPDRRVQGQDESQENSTPTQNKKRTNSEGYAANFLCPFLRSILMTLRAFTFPLPRMRP